MQKSHRFPDEQIAVIRKCAGRGLHDRLTAAALVEAGFQRRHHDTIRRVRKLLGILISRDARQRASSAHVYCVERIVDPVAMDAAFCDAVRALHPERETGPRRTVVTSSVPMRALPTPIVSSTGFMVP